MNVQVKYHDLRFVFFLLVALSIAACSKDEMRDPPIGPGSGGGMMEDTTSLGDGPVDFSKLQDTYGQLASPDLTSQWAHYNTHDPSYVVDEEFTYSYSTDVAFGHAIRPGLQIRRSKNLVEWEFVGWGFPVIPTQGANYIRQNGGEPNQGIWAPYIMKVDNEYRLYYSLASNIGRLSAIGMATASDPKGPFLERGLVVTSLNDASTHTNAIDPTVIIDKDGSHWMYYGSSWDGIYRMELDPSTGLAMNEGDKGVRVAHRGFTSNTINGNIEAPEIIYHPEFDMYYLFIAYDWLETKYNVRVGRSENATGPFYDIYGNDVNQFIDDQPMILAPYQFDGHSGWQGVSHPGVFEKDGDFYIGHQGRPGVNPFYMVMHTRQIFWTEDGWPLVSCQRFATEEETPVEEAEIAGEYERIFFDYEVVPGFAETQVSPNFRFSERISLNADGTISGSKMGNWTYSAPWLNVSYDDGTTEKLRIERGRDWENEVASTVLFTGLNDQQIAVWGKKLQ